MRYDATGTADCRTGELNVAVPLKSDVYGGACPVCTAGFCDSGASAGLACSPQSPSGTSSDCLPSSGVFAGTTSTFDLVYTTGSQTKRPLAQNTMRADLLPPEGRAQ